MKQIQSSFRSASLGKPMVNFSNIIQAVFLPISFRQKLLTQTVSTEKLRKTLLFEKAAHKMLVKLTPILHLILEENVSVQIDWRAWCILCHPVTIVDVVRHVLSPAFVQQLLVRRIGSCWEKINKLFNVVQSKELKLEMLYTFVQRVWPINKVYICKILVSRVSDNWDKFVVIKSVLRLTELV